uniref:Thrombomodulin n=1 Tax=Amphiprion percula TaxID=161767 RepID=A0A3P8TRH2_AMPPE
MAIMLLIFLLQLINSFEGLSGAEHETLCTSNACFTLHMEKVGFEKAQQNCDDNGGYLMTLRDRHEEDVLRSLLSLLQRQHQGRLLKVWIGLKLHRQDCVLPDKALRGFKWVSGKEDSNYSNWKREPVSTCTEERCVRVDYTFSGQSQLKWIAGPCKIPAFFACKFYFKGMCKPLALLGPGQITYTPPFSKEPQRSEMKSFPIGTYAIILCSNQLSHYSVCKGVEDTYSWNDPGPFCRAGKRNCEIINGGCEHVCHQDADDVQCSCKEGYDLEDDGLTCSFKDLCSPDTCEHQCVMGESGYSCRCPDGFKLNEDQRSCSDTDECQSQACRDHLCVNTHGSYMCVCKDGYKIVDGECSDVDECKQPRCEHNCLNSIGSFSCYCNEGFVLSKDGHSCVDINECVSARCLAELTCVNTAGSFICTSPKGFHLETDGSTYAPHVTVTSATSPGDSADEETQENFTESLTRTAVELAKYTVHRRNVLRYVKAVHVTVLKAF